MGSDKRRYYLAETYDDNLLTAGIIRKDNEKILQKQGFEPLRFNNKKDGSAIVKLLRLGELLKLVFKVDKTSVVVFHFPILAKAYKMLLALFNMRGVNTIAIVIDVDGLRSNNEKMLRQEVTTLNMFRHIIAHNEAMKALLGKYINEEKISSIGVFDFPVRNETATRVLSKSVCFAGNFEKATFVQELFKVPGIRFNLYGPSYDAAPQQNISYKGSFPSHELPHLLDGGFGLVWDGNSIDKCDAYLLYNNPYKFSLYLAAGLPVIVWEKSALTPFVVSSGIGITVPSLYAIEDGIRKLSVAEYERMQKNILPIKEKITNGYFLTTAIKNLIDENKL